MEESGEGVNVSVQVPLVKEVLVNGSSDVLVEHTHIALPIGS